VLRPIDNFANGSDPLEDLVGGGGPEEGTGMAVVVGDEGFDPSD
jgi:hypothetical protein